MVETELTKNDGKEELSSGVLICMWKESRSQKRERKEGLENRERRIGLDVMMGLRCILAT